MKKFSLECALIVTSRKLFVNFYAYLGETFLKIRKIYTPAELTLAKSLWGSTPYLLDFISPEGKLRSSFTDGEYKFYICQPCAIAVRQTGGTCLYKNNWIWKERKIFKKENNLNVY